MITSDQIHEKEFSFKLRGYNDVEVDAYLDQLVEACGGDDAAK